jgi:hypothetical protein
MYPEDVHALDRPATEADAWINIALWLGEHLQQPLPQQQPAAAAGTAASSTSAATA